MASGSRVSAWPTDSARDFAVLPGKTGTDELEPGLTGTGLMDPGSTSSGMTGSGSEEPGFSWKGIRHVPERTSFERPTVRCCPEKVRESGRAAIRSSDLAPRSASS